MRKRNQRAEAAPDRSRWAPLVALQILHNLVERTVEGDLIPMLRPWA
jgi:aryl-alcohol dehydrogenase-like predicted oxidoreductase